MRKWLHLLVVMSPLSGILFSDSAPETIWFSERCPCASTIRALSLRAFDSIRLRWASSDSWDAASYYLPIFEAGLVSAEISNGLFAFPIPCEVELQRLGSQRATRTPPDLTTAPQVFRWFIVQSDCGKSSIQIKQRVWPFVLRKNNFNGNVISYFTRNCRDCAMNPCWILVWSNSFIIHTEWRLLILNASWILKHISNKKLRPFGSCGSQAQHTQYRHVCAQTAREGAKKSLP